MDCELFSEDQENLLSQQAHGFVELEPHDYCYIDRETVKTLELVQNNAEPSNKKHCLLGYLNAYTSTTTGARLLKETILRPLCHLPTLEHRLDCIEFLVARVDVLGRIINCVKKFGQGIDLDSVIPCLITLYKSHNNGIELAERRLDALTTIEMLVSQVFVLTDALETDQQTLNIYRIALSDPSYTEILNVIYQVIDTDVKVSTGKRSRMFRIKQGVDKLFDIARSTYDAAINDLEQYVRELNHEDGLSWKLSYNSSRGYFLIIDHGQLPNGYVLPPKYIRVQRCARGALSCTTIELMQSNVRANVSYENSMTIANEILTTAIGSVMDHSRALVKLVDIVGMLDLTTSFAKLVAHSKTPLVRPKFTAAETIIKNGRHPVLEIVLEINNLKTVPNDTVLNVYNQNFLLITGPNMGGKSVYLKQIGIIQVMAQLGCFVPAESAHIKLMNQIVARSGTNDDNHSNCSSFMWEMKGIASAFKQDEASHGGSVLYIIDEVGRGTSIDDGASYSFAVAEELASRKYCFTIFATHFDQIFALTKYSNIHAYHFKYDDDFESSSKLRISHKLASGFAEKDHYGFKLAEACGLPNEILLSAKLSADIRI